MYHWKFVVFLSIWTLIVVHNLDNHDIIVGIGKSLNSMSRIEVHTYQLTVCRFCFSVSLAYTTQLLAQPSNRRHVFGGHQHPRSALGQQSAITMSEFFTEMTQEACWHVTASNYISSRINTHTESEPGRGIEHEQMWYVFVEGKFKLSTHVSPVLCFRTNWPSIQWTTGHQRRWYKYIASFKTASGLNRQRYSR